MDDSLVGVDVDGHIAVVELRNPPHNFASTPMLVELADRLEALDSDPECRAAVIASEGRSFCAGASFASGGLLSESSGSAEGLKSGIGEFYSNGIRIFRIGIPLVAAVHGPAVGAGVGLALACDLRVTSSEAFFATNFVRLGIHPGFATTLTLPELIGPSAASDMMLTGRRVFGDEALALGLADRLVAAEDVRSAAFELASEIAAAAPLAVAATRATLRHGLADRAEAVLKHELAEQVRLAGTADSAEGISALLEKRDPEFKGE